jgi:uncharacterized membrane protein
MAVKKGPELLEGKLLPKLADAGGPAGLLDTVKDAVGDKVGGDRSAGDGTGKGRRMPIQQSVDVAAPIDIVYDEFTQFEDWPKFMHRVERIEQRDDATLMWHENIWGVRRSWEAEIVEQEPCERLVWRSKGGPQTIGVVTFHKLSDNLTRIAITMDFQPKGLFEKTASGTRISRRALKSDLMRLKAFIELRDEATGQWRGRIEEGEPVDEERDERDEEREEEEPRASEEDEERDEDEEDYEEEEDEEPRAEEEDEELEEDDEELEEEEEEEEPRARRSGRFARDEEEGEEEPEEEEERPRRRSRRKATASSGGEDG